MELSVHFHTLPTLCVNRVPGTHSTWGWLQPRASFDVNWTKIGIEQRDLIVLFLQDIVHTSHLPSTKYSKSFVGGGHCC